MTNFNGAVSPLGYQGIDILQQPIFIGNQVRAPGAGDVYQSGTIWDYVSGTTHTFYISCGGQPSGGTTAGVWTVFGSSSGDVQSVLGTTNQITVITASGVATVSLPSAITTPGSLTTTTNLTGGTGVTATTGNIVASAGNINATLGSISAGTTVTAGTGVTATTGNITATNGNIIRGTAGNKDVYSSVASTTTAGANSAGTVTLVGGTATISTTSVTASSIIRLYRQGVGSTGAAALGFLTIGTTSAGVSFVINSVQPADATALQASDVSVVAWEIVN